MTDLVKIGALAAGAYLLYTQFSKPSAAKPATGSTTPAPAPAPTPTPAPAPAPAAPAPPQASPVAPTDENLRRAAGYKPWAYEAGATKMNFHQWNWYRSHYNGTLPVPAPEDVGAGDGSALITASEYHALLNAKGLAGLALDLASRW